MKNSIKERYNVRPIDSFQCRQWLVYKHYAKRVASIEFSFALYKDATLVGVCTYGTPPRVMNDGESVFSEYRVKTLELNRLVTNDGLDKNALSFFVSQTFLFLPKPCCVVSYADDTFGHIGYIYQATNFIYTGLNQVHEKTWYLNGKEVHQRTLSGWGLTDAKKKKEFGLDEGEYTQKHRYFMFLGGKREVGKMKKDLIYKIEPYPKGENKRYDASFQPSIQQELFQ